MYLLPIDTWMPYFLSHVGTNPIGELKLYSQQNISISLQLTDLQKYHMKRVLFATRQNYLHKNVA